MTIGRNDPCHCGSGKKYKRCHESIDPPEHLGHAPPAERCEGCGSAHHKHWTVTLRCRSCKQGPIAPVDGNDGDLFGPHRCPSCGTLWTLNQETHRWRLLKPERTENLQS